MLLFPRDSSDKAVILLIIAKLVQASSGTHAVSLATKGGIFHSSPAENSFFLILFYRHMWKWVTAVHVTVFFITKILMHLCKNINLHLFPFTQGRIAE